VNPVRDTEKEYIRFLIASHPYNDLFFKPIRRMIGQESHIF